MIAVFNDCNMTVSVAHAKSPFVPYDKVIWRLMCHFQMKGSRNAGCYLFVVLIQNTQEAYGIQLWSGGTELYVHWRKSQTAAALFLVQLLRF
jgi:hypothetical protein